MPDKQAWVAEAMESEYAAPTLPQAQKMKKLSRAGELNVNTIHSIMEEKVSAPASLLSVPYDLGDKQFTGFVRKFHKEINWFHMDYYEAIFPALTPVQLDYLRQQMDEIRSAVDKLYEQVKGM